MVRSDRQSDATGITGCYTANDTAHGLLVGARHSVTYARAVNPALELTVACDGSCLKNPDGPTGWAWVAEDGRSARGGLATGTNNIGELLAVRNLLADLPDTPLLVLIDSQYAMKASTEWLPGWKRKGWRTSANKPVLNLEIIQDIDRLMTSRATRGIPIRFQWVKGHHIGGAFPLNDAADVLAGQASSDAARGEITVVRTDEHGVSTTSPGEAVAPTNPPAAVLAPDTLW
ncbi:MAG: hypothetical protein JWP10_333 [Nocardioidaceae bacterium]|nr:hypothetical protein [Nocardioidaceae bacterium]